MSKTAAVITGKDNDDNEVKVVVKRPTPNQETRSKIVMSAQFNEAIIGGAVTRTKLDTFMRDEGIWSDKHQAELDALGIKVWEGERQLVRGGRDADGNKFSKEQMKKLAIDMATWRQEQLNLLADTRMWDAMTADGIADNAKFDYLVSVCTFNEDGTLFFKDVEDYQIASELSNILYKFDPDYAKKNPEQKFLREYGFVNEDGQFINKDEERVDVRGNRLDEDGYLVNKDGVRVDKDGYRLDDKGQPTDDFVPFDGDVAKKAKVKKVEKPVEAEESLEDVPTELVEK